MASTLKQFRHTFAAGLLATVPITLTVVVIVWIFRALTAVTPFILYQIPSPEVQALLRQPGMLFAMRMGGLLVLFVLIYCVGLFARNVMGRRLILWLDALVLRLPMVRIIYGTFQQLGRAILKGGGTGVFRKVALVEYPLKGTFVIGFVTGPSAAECSERTARDLVTVFVPTTPNPTSGFLLFIPKEDVRVLDMTVMEGMRLVISGGVVTPEREARQRLVDDTAYD